MAFNFSETEVKDIIYNYINNNKTVKEIGLLYNVNQSVIKRILDKNNIEIYKRTPSYNKINLPHEQITNLIYQYQNTTIPIDIISNTFNITSIVLYRILKENNILITNRRIRNFTDIEKTNIINLYKNNNSTITIAKIYNSYRK
jgi:intein-encoded DNA endonuclease-like protein